MLGTDFGRSRKMTFTLIDVFKEQLKLKARLVHSSATFRMHSEGHHCKLSPTSGAKCVHGTDDCCSNEGRRSDSDTRETLTSFSCVEEKLWKSEEEEKHTLLPAAKTEVCVCASALYKTHSWK